MAEYLLKVVLIGSSNVGKSSLLLRYVDDKFTESHVTTIGVDFRVKNIPMNGKVARMQLWDTGGQERFNNIVSLFYRGTEGLIIVFDVTDDESFLKVPSWLAEATELSQPGCVTILVGNKTDMPYRAVDRETAQAFADKHGIQYVETSAKTDSNVHQVFDSLASEILRRKIEMGLPPLRSANMDQSFVIESHELSQPGWCYWGTSSCFSY